MKPRTKLQHQVYKLSKDLPTLTVDQKKWALINCLDHVAYRTKQNVSCLDCGNVWIGPQKVKTCTCPACGTRLTVKDTRKKKLDQGSTTFAILDVVDDFQLVRFFQVHSYHRAGWKPDQYISEIIQQWFVPNGKLTIVGKTISFSNSGWSGDMEIRANISNYYTNNKYDVYAYKIHPCSKFLPIYKRNGFNVKIENIQPYSFLKVLLYDSKLETLLKSGQLNLAACSDQNKIYTYWNSIKICIRRKYIVKEAKTWLDYLDLLDYFRRDLRSEKYVCPKCLHKEHNRLVAKRAAILRRQREQRELEEAKKDQLALEKAKVDYERNRSAFFGMVFSAGEITVKVLESIDEFIAESEAHKHCVFTNKYYNKEDSLILSARIGDKLIETIELSLSKMRIEQSRGNHNQATEYNKEIIDLVTKNIPVIRKKYKQLKSQAA